MDVNRLLVLAGPSGVGKGTVRAALQRLLPELWTSVSVTTRVPRPAEVPGRDYIFVSPDEFDRMVARGELLEHADYAGSSYGTPRLPVEEALLQGRPALLEIELLGARQVREALGKQAFLVLLAPPSEAELLRRLTSRGTEDEAAVGRRMARARQELAAAAEFDAVVINDDVEQAAQRLVTLWRPPLELP